jgi:hypothetical protein
MSRYVDDPFTLSERGWAYDSRRGHDEDDDLPLSRDDLRELIRDELRAARDEEPDAEDEDEDDDAEDESSDEEKEIAYSRARDEVDHRTDFDSGSKSAVQLNADRRRRAADARIALDASNQLPAKARRLLSANDADFNRRFPDLFQKGGR